MLDNFDITCSATNLFQKLTILYVQIILDSFIHLLIQEHDTLKIKLEAFTETILRKYCFQTIKDEILSMKAKLQKEYGVTLQYHQLNNIQSFILCQNNKYKNCSFVQGFRKKNGDPNQQNYCFIIHNSSHSLQCLQLTNRTSTSQNKKMDYNQTLELKIQNQLIFTPKLTQNNDNVRTTYFDMKQEIKQPAQNQTILKQKKQYEDRSKEIDTHDNEMKKYYKQNQIPAFKKLLVHKYCALVSKSTQVEPQTNKLVKVIFRCKNSQRLNCLFTQVLQLVPQSNQLIYELVTVNDQHLPQCRMDLEELRYYENTKKIDENMELIQSITRQLCVNNQNVKPKTVLEMLKNRLGEQSAYFIYDGLSDKNHRRAIKKYFDNAVGKIRNKIKSQI